MDSVTPQTRLWNLLDQLDRERLGQHGEVVPAESGHVLYEERGVIDSVYFPRTAVASLVRTDQEKEVEIVTVGREGFLGLPVVFGSTENRFRTVVQVPGELLRVPLAEFRRIVNESETLQDRLARYALAFMNQMGQLAACNQLHSAQQKMCRWLLMCVDRVGEQRFYLTQQYLSEMLGVRRATVTTIAGQLQKSGAIRYSRGNMAILDREQLAGCACDCYFAIRAELTQLQEPANPLLG